MKHFFAITVLSLLLTQCSPLFSQQKPNILFIAVDDLRPELGCYGNKIVKTPNIDRLATHGVVFDRAYCAQAVCSPSRTAMLTGLRPDTTKVWDLDTHFRASVPNAVTLPQHFKANGWHCAAVGKIFHESNEDGRSWSEPHWYPTGVTIDTDPSDWTKRKISKHDVRAEEYRDSGKDLEVRMRGRIPKNGPAFEASSKSDDELPDGATAAEAVKRISAFKAKSQPFFLAVGFSKPHLPFVAPKKYWDLYKADDIPRPATDQLPAGTDSFVGHASGELHGYPGVPKGNPIPDDFAKKLRHGYYASVSFVDAQIGRVLDGLDKAGLAENTIIVLWGDHGWHLGDHGLWNKHTNFEIATRSPLVISVPKSNTAGKTCAAPVEFVDVYPTLVDLCGLSKPKELAGSSLKAYLSDPDAPMQKPAISVYPKSSKERGGALMGYSIRTEKWRCTFWRERNGSAIRFTELYDEKNDPPETKNLADQPEHAELIASLKKYLPPVGSDAPGGKNKRTTDN